MKALSILLTIVISGTLPACMGVPTPTTPASAVQKETQSVLKSVNSYRESQGAKWTPKQNSQLASLAQSHADELAKVNEIRANHNGFGNRALVAQRIYGFGMVSENVASYSRHLENPGPRATKLWEGSPPHKKNMLGDWSFTGIGYAENKEGTFVVQMFAN